MKKKTTDIGSHVVLEMNNLQRLFDIFTKEGYKILGPMVRDSSIVLDEIKSIEDLPVGLTDIQEKAKYRITKSNNDRFFGFLHGPESWKKFLLPPEEILFNVDKTKENWKVKPIGTPNTKLAFIGVRPCEIKAIHALDKIFINGEYKDPAYSVRRKNSLIVALNCSKAGGTCFCTSMGTGPKTTEGFDLAMTEILDNNEHYFLIEIGSKLGISIMDMIKCKAADNTHIEKANSISTTTAQQMGRQVETTLLKEMLYHNSEHPQWKDVASRCLTCGNCTMVCPTCFCTTVNDYTDLRGKEASRSRKWDSCFTMDYSYIHGGSVRYSADARYRQWLTHKFASWIDQYGFFGCVGCGRCITWCPVSIDVTEEIHAIQNKHPNLNSKS